MSIGNTPYEFAVAEQPYLSTNVSLLKDAPVSCFGALSWAFPLKRFVTVFYEVRPFHGLSVFTPVPQYFEDSGFVMCFEISTCEASGFVFLCPDCICYFVSFVISCEFFFLIQ